MRIAYFTTAQEADEFKKFYIDRNIETNNSNQVFHSNFIDCLALEHEVMVFSCRSDAKEVHPSQAKTKGKITWNYLATKTSSFKNVLSQRKEVSKAKKYTDIAFVDTTNARCLMAARKYCKNKRIPMIGIVTDNPQNISEQKKAVSKIIMFLSKKCSAYICVTEGLNSLFNKKNKPHLIIKGFNKKGKIATKKPVDYNYVFYAGTLLKKYGIYDLIDAYKTIKNKEIRLVIAGHHEEPEFQDYIKGNDKIIYLGNIDNSDIISYEEHSLCNVNPRPFMEDIDKYSVPSKVIEYSSRNSLVVSGASSSLRPEFRTSILWVDNRNSLSKKLNEAVKMTKPYRVATIREMNEICEKRFSQNANSKRITKFISTLK